MRWLAVLTVVLSCATAAATAGSGGEGFFIFLDGVAATPLDTDQVIGTTVDLTANGTSLNRRVADWSSGTAGRLGLGYQWSGGNKLTVSYWSFDEDQSGRLDASGADGFYTSFGNYAATYSGSYSYGAGTLSYFYGFDRADFTNNVKADTLDVDWAQVRDMGENLTLEWSLGVRFASFEENLDVATRYTGGYSYTSPSVNYSYYVTYTQRETSRNKSDMFGFRGGVRGTLNVSRQFAITGGVGLSKVSGEVESTQTSRLLDSGGTALFQDVITAKDKDRSGTMLDYDLAVVWMLQEDRWRISLGYEQSSWEGIADDLLRDHVQLARRDRVGFSGWKVGVQLRF